MTPSEKCQVCSANDWLELPDPHPHRSVTTASRILEEPLGKSQCNACGFVQRTRIEFLGLTDYYEQDYANYYERAGTNEYHKKRYAEIVNWMRSTLGSSFQPGKIMDIGCGQGWAMEAIRHYFPGSDIEGLEPSHYNVKVAREKGFKVHEGKLEEVGLTPRSYDLVFCNNVIQHVNKAKDFLLQLKNLVSENGVLIITCPDGSRPNIEILWADQNFSFLPMNLLGLAENSGFRTVYWTSSSNSPSLPPAQLMLLTNNKGYGGLITDTGKAMVDRDAIFRSRSNYLTSFERINKYLVDETSSFDKVYNFGASYWTSVLAGYCPDYWKRVLACVVDDNNQLAKFLGSDVVLSGSIEPGSKDALVLGIGPGWQESLKEKLAGKWKKLITWDSFISY